jgi:hypothetical protein
MNKKMPTTLILHFTLKTKLISLGIILTSRYLSILLLLLLSSIKKEVITGLAILNNIALDLADKLIQVILVRFEFFLAIQDQTVPFPALNQPFVMQVVEFLYIIVLQVFLLVAIALLYPLETFLW